MQVASFEEVYQVVSWNENSRVSFNTQAMLLLVSTLSGRVYHCSHCAAEVCSSNKFECPIVSFMLGNFLLDISFDVLPYSGLRKTFDAKVSSYDA